MTPRSRHIDIPIAFLHEQHHKSFQDFLIKTDCMMADIGTKPLPPILHKRFKYWCTGQQFLPPKGHPHYDDLTMQYYEISFDKILKILRSWQLICYFVNGILSKLIQFLKRGGSCHIPCSLGSSARDDARRSVAQPLGNPLGANSIRLRASIVFHSVAFRSWISLGYPHNKL